MIIKAICISGIKGYKEEVIYNFSNYTEILGGNALGKSSIADSISWGFYGCNFDGQEKQDLALLNNEVDVMYVVIDFILYGKEYRLLRKKGKTMTLKLNGERITQKELFEILPQKDLFLSIFNPNTLINQTPMKARKTFLNMLPPIDTNKILEENNAWDKAPIIDKYDNANEGIKVISDQLERKRDFLKSKQGELSMISEFLSNENISNQNQLDFSDKDASRLMELEEIISNIKSSKPEYISSSELLSEIEKLDDKIKYLKSSKYLNEQLEYINLMKIDVAGLNGELKYIENSIERMTDIDSICPSCGQEISEEHRESEILRLLTLKSDLDEKIANYNETITLISNIENENEEIFYQQINEEINILLEKKNTLQEQLSSINETNKSIEADFKNSLDKEISKYTEEFNNLREKQQLFNKNKIEIEIKKANIEKYSLRKNEILNEINKLNEDILTLEIEIQFLKDFNAMYVSYIGDIMNSWLKDVNIELFKIVKSTGEIKDAFNISYKGKEYNLLSNSEKVLVSIEISEMLNSCLEESIPLFIDNAECILNVPRINNQLILAKVSDGPIRLRYEEENKTTASVVKSNDENIFDYDSEHQQMTLI